MSQGAAHAHSDQQFSMRGQDTKSGDTCVARLATRHTQRLLHHGRDTSRPFASDAVPHIENCCTRIAAIDRIVGAACVPVGADARRGRVERVGGHEPAEHGIVEPGMQVLQAGFEVELFADVALGLRQRRELLAPGLRRGRLRAGSWRAPAERRSSRSPGGRWRDGRPRAEARSRLGIQVVTDPTRFASAVRYLVQTPPASSMSSPR